MRVLLIGLISILILAACSKQQESDATGKATNEKKVSVIRHQDAAQIQRGYALFEQNCASCHGANAQGAANWSKAGADGKYPPPPLNGTGHAWHHPKRALVSTIKFGTIRLGGNMPAWQGKLNDQDIDDIIAWFQSKWPDELYAVWHRRDQADQQSRR